MTGDNPILNNPYEEPRFHYATNPSGELDYAKVLGGRRIFTGQLQSIPVRQQQPEIFSVQDLAAEYAPLLVNRLRVEVARWRNDKYPQTTRITRELLTFWFLNAEREPRQKLFFAQREAVETAIWLNEVAPKSNAGTFILQELAASTREQESLPRIAFKMATGSGKTVVMAALIAYHFFNRREYANDTRFADNFLIVAPGVTIRDRLSVLRVPSGSPRLASIASRAQPPSRHHQLSRIRAPHASGQQTLALRRQGRGRWPQIGGPRGLRSGLPTCPGFPARFPPAGS
jgi:type III restriction enzyme